MTKTHMFAPYEQRDIRCMTR